MDLVTQGRDLHILSAVTDHMRALADWARHPVTPKHT